MKIGTVVIAMIVILTTAAHHNQRVKRQMDSQKYSGLTITKEIYEPYVIDLTLSHLGDKVIPMKTSMKRATKE